MWPRLAAGMAALEHVQSREVRLNAWPVTVQFNPARAASSLAKVDAVSVARRRCFLCPGELDAEERGVRAGGYVLLGNPMPIVGGHLTVPHESHAPQELGPHVESMLALAEQLSGEFSVLYNGPQCGASAPDHMHLQAAPRTSVPIEQVLDRGTTTLERTAPGGVSIRVVCDAASAADATRRVIVVSGGERQAVTSAIRAVLAGLPVPSDGGEPPINVMVWHDAGAFTALVIPRGAHRPRCYFESGAAQMLFSPGVMDMAGILITVRREDFERTDATVLVRVYREVGASEATCRGAVEAAASRAATGG